MEDYTKKLTADVAWLRPVPSETWLMRIAGIVTEGWAETSALGGYVRWYGTFRAKHPAKPDHNGVIAVEGLVETRSSRLILPSVASNWMGQYFDTLQADKAVDPADAETRQRTGLMFKPKPQFDGGFTFGLDLVLRPPKPGKPSTTGYEFGVQIVKADARFDPFDAIAGDVFDAMPLDALPALLPGKTIDTPPKDDTDLVEPGRQAAE